MTKHAYYNSSKYPEVIVKYVTVCSLMIYLSDFSSEKWYEGLRKQQSNTRWVKKGNRDRTFHSLFSTKTHPHRHKHTTFALLAEGRQTWLHPIRGVWFLVRPNSSGTHLQRGTSGPGHHLYWPPCRLLGHCYLKKTTDVTVNVWLWNSGRGIAE